MMQRTLNIISSISLLAVIFLINQGVGIEDIIRKTGIEVGWTISKWISYLIYIVITIVYAWILTLLFKKLRCGQIVNKDIDELDVDNSSLLAMILAYVFVGLSISNGWTLLVILLFLLVFNLCGSSYIYNPIFYLFGYRYYYVRSSKTRFLVMSKIKYPLGAQADFSNCRCLNDYTYIDMDKK